MSQWKSKPMVVLHNNFQPISNNNAECYISTEIAFNDVQKTGLQ